MFLAHGGQHSTPGAQYPDSIGVQHKRTLIRSEGLRHTRRSDTGIVDQNVDFACALEDLAYSLVNRSIAGNVEFDDRDALFGEYVRVGLVPALGITHRSVDCASGLRQSFCCVTAKARARACDQNCL